MFRSDLSDAEQNDTATKAVVVSKQTVATRNYTDRERSQSDTLSYIAYLSGTERYFNLLVIDTVEVLLSVLLDGLLELRLASLYLFI